MPLDIEPQSVRPKGQRIKSARTPKDAQDVKKNGELHLKLLHS